MRWFTTLVDPFLSFHQPLSDRPRCARCGDPVGVYERIVADDGSGAYEASLMIDPELERSGARLYHLACHEQSRPSA